MHPGQLDLMPQSFEQTFFASFDDSDPGGIVFFGNYYHIAHRLFEAFVISTGLDWSDWFSGKDILIPLVHSEADYKAPLFAGKNYLGRVQIENLGSSSVSVSYQFFTEDGEHECAALKTVHVFVDKASMNKIEIPEKYRKALT